MLTHVVDKIAIFPPHQSSWNESEQKKRRQMLETQAWCFRKLSLEVVRWKLGVYPGAFLWWGKQQTLNFLKKKEGGGVCFKNCGFSLDLFFFSVCFPSKFYHCDDWWPVFETTFTFNWHALFVSIKIFSHINWFSSSGFHKQHLQKTRRILLNYRKKCWISHSLFLECFVWGYCHSLIAEENKFWRVPPSRFCKNKVHYLTAGGILIRTSSTFLIFQLL